MVFLLQLAIALLIAVGGSHCLRPGKFQIVGPGGGGAMFHPTISTHDPNTVLVSCDLRGSYISHDGGESWRMFNLRGVVQFFVFDPLDSKVIYAQADGLWRSEDSGVTWSLIHPKPSTLKEIRMNSDHADEELVAEPIPLGTVTAMAVDPSDSRIIYAAAGDKKNGVSSLFVSYDAAVNWIKLENLPGIADRIWVNPHSPKNARTLFLAGAHFLIEKTSTESKKLSIPNVKALADISIGVTPEGQPIFYVIGDESAFVSDDETRTWRRIKLGSESEKIRAIATSLHHPEIAYASYREPDQDGIT